MPSCSQCTTRPVRHLATCSTRSTNRHSATVTRGLWCVALLFPLNGRGCAEFDSVWVVLLPLITPTYTYIYSFIPSTLRQSTTSRYSSTRQTTRYVMNGGTAVHAVTPVGLSGTARRCKCLQTSGDGGSRCWTTYVWESIYSPTAENKASFVFSQVPNILPVDASGKAIV